MVCRPRTQRWCGLRRLWVKKASRRFWQVSGLTMAVGLEDGFGEPLFAACFVFSVIVRRLGYAAASLRLTGLAGYV